MTVRRKKEWFDDEDFWREIYSFMFPERLFTETPEQIEKVLALTKPKGKAALDLCCGPGRCSIAFAQAGFQVTAVDRTKYLLDKARARAKAAKMKIEWVQADMRDFARADAFHLALSMFTSFGYFDDKREDLQVLDNILTSLKLGGVCLIDVMSKERLAGILQPTTCNELPDGAKVIQRHEIFDDWTRIRNEWILIRKGRAKSFKFHHTIYSGQELKDRMELVGFTEVKLFGNLDGEEYGPNAHRLIAVGRKTPRRKGEKHRIKASNRRPKDRG
jgi:SAM-dependent methyltransferase